MKAERLRTGFPDRLVFAPGGRVFIVELKQPTGALRTAQQLVGFWLSGLGFRVWKLWSHEDVDAFFEAWDAAA